MLTKSLQALLVAIAVAVGFAANAAAQPAPAQQVATADSAEVRNEFRDLLRRNPPEVGTILKLDPALFADKTYLANYPAIAAFVAEHPEVGRNPRYFLDFVNDTHDRRAFSESPPVWNRVLERFTEMTIFFLIAGVFVWLVNTAVQQRRWSRLSRVQSEVHSKLLDRFTNNEELLAYMQSPAGVRFFESAPMGERPLSAAVSRVLWSVQVGIVVAAAGIGLLAVRANVTAEAAEPLFAFGIVALCVGLGFVLSAVISYIVARRIGAWEERAAAEARGNV